MENSELKLAALKAFLGFNDNSDREVDDDYSDEIETQDDKTFTWGNDEYMVLTDKEADEEAKSRIEDSLWAFRAGFIVDNSNIDKSQMTPMALDSFIKSFEKMQGEMCEDANPIVRALVQDSDGEVDGFVEEALRADGRGHFISSYDSNENEETVEDETFYIYIINQ